jgi:hypothetical protein
MRARKRSRKRTSIRFTVASLVRSVTGPLTVFTVRPSIRVRRSGTLSATRSTTLSLTASRSVAETDARTAFSAHSTLRPRSVAMVRTKAAASFSIFFIMSLSAPPPTATGWAAPIFVAGAIAATCAAIVMNTPADAARAPVGATYTMTGISALRMVCTIDRMERSSPPGVSSWMMRACERSAWARSTAVAMRRTVTGVIAPSISIRDTGGGAWAETAHGAPARSSAVRRARRASGAGFMASTEAMIARPRAAISGGPGATTARTGDWRQAGS